MARQADLFHTPEPALAQVPVFCHQDFLQKLEQNRRNNVGKRAALLLEHLVVDPGREFFKSTLGLNRGWRRSRLGGNAGSHFYAWWAPKRALPLQCEPGFERAPDGAVFVRDIRHHDDHSECRPQTFEENYLPLTVRDLWDNEYGPSPLTPVQSGFVSARQNIRIIKGYPGSGKTTALWHAADDNCVKSALYVTYSSDLAALARAHFDRYAPGSKKFAVSTLARFIRDLAGVAAPEVSDAECRKYFLKQTAGLPPRLLGPWVDDRKAFYDEVHAHLVGAALPVGVARFPMSVKPRLSDRDYRDRRLRVIGRDGVEAVCQVIATLEKRDPNLYEQSFPELMLAWKAAQELLGPGRDRMLGRGLLNFDCIAIDEAQDLTPIQAFVLAELGAVIRTHASRSVTLLVAGDEAQTVRPTDFEWGWFQDILHRRLGSPQEFELAVNLRSARRIARLINSVWDLYAYVGKSERPGGIREAAMEEDASDQLMYCAASHGPELEALLTAFANREGTAVICLEDSVPEYVPASLRSQILSVHEAKGLDFQAVCVLDPGKQIRRILAVDERVRRDHDVEPLSKRLAIDQLRVAVSRPTDRIYFLEVDPDPKAADQCLQFLHYADQSPLIAPVIPEVVLKTLEEELLDIEERVQLCQRDALQYLEVKPEMAWSRAKQAAALVGRASGKSSTVDAELRQSAHLTDARVCLTLAMRRVTLAGALAIGDLYSQAEAAAIGADKDWLADAAITLRDYEGRQSEAAILRLFVTLAEAEAELEPWFRLELSSRQPDLLKRLEQIINENPAMAGEFLPVLPAAYRLYDLQDGEDRVRRLRRQAIRGLVDVGLFQPALKLIEQEPEPQQELVAACREGLGQYAEAAAIFRSLGRAKDALRNYRMVPDFERALELIGELGDAPAREGLEWVRRLQQVLAERPKNFARMATDAEKKFVFGLLEANLGAPRTPRTPRPRKSSAQPKKEAAKPRR
jgi:hypothetical protein